TAAAQRSQESDDVGQAGLLHAASRAAEERAIRVEVPAIRENCIVRGPPLQLEGLEKPCDGIHQSACGGVGENAMPRGWLLRAREALPGAFAKNSRRMGKFIIRRASLAR